MPNRAEYLAIWLGITRMGAVVALINTNLRGRALAHCLAIADPRHIIVAESLMPALAEVAVRRPDLAARSGFRGRAGGIFRRAA